MVWEGQKKVHDTTLRSQNAEQLRENAWLRCRRKPQEQQERQEQQEQQEQQEEQQERQEQQEQQERQEQQASLLRTQQASFYTKQYTLKIIAQS